MPLRRRLLALAVCLLAAPSLRAGDAGRPLVAVLGTCSALTSNTYPADSVNWFDAGRHSQVIFYAHLLFPLQVEAAVWPTGAWHPPLRVSPTAQAVASAELLRDEHLAVADWLDPQGHSIAHYSLSFPARVRSDWLDLHGRQYIPHTLAMAIGTRDLRPDSGQTKLPSLEGQYTVELRVDGQPLGLAFFRMLKVQAAASAQPGAPSPPAPAAASATAR